MPKTKTRTPRRAAVAAHLGETCADRRAEAERLLARYPGLAEPELAELLHWYRREASAMDVALVASNERLREPFEAFSRKHIQPFSWREKLITAVLGTGVVALLAIGLLPEAS